MASSARSASASKDSSFSMTARRPLAVVNHAFTDARGYAVSAEEASKGVVSYNSLDDQL